MKTVSIQDLKARISALLAEAAAGTRVLITKHRRPLAMLSPAELEHVHIGKRFGRGRLRALFERATDGRYLEGLAEDRGDES